MKSYKNIGQINNIINLWSSTQVTLLTVREPANHMHTDNRRNPYMHIRARYRDSTTTPS